MSHKAIQIFHGGGVVNAALDTGIINVEDFDTVDIGVFVADFASGEIRGDVVTESGDLFYFVLVTGLTANTMNWYTLGGRGAMSAAINGPTVSGMAGPEVPRLMQFRAAPGAGARVFMFIFGHKREDD